MNNSKYLFLLVKKFKGKLDAQERKDLERWLSSEDDAVATGKAMEKVWDLSNQYKDTYEPDVEAGLTRFKQRIASQETGQTRSNIVKMPRRRFPLAWAAAIAALILTLGWYVLGPGNPRPVVASTLELEQQTVELPDGSTVVLNENSTLDFSTFDKNDVRLVRFSGEAFFDIQPDAEHPFVILTESTEIKVLGTSFNVRAYPAETFTEVEVESGQVSFSGKDLSEHQILNANERGVLQQEGTLSKTAVSAQNASSWRTQSLSFQSMPLNEVAGYLERHFKVTIEVAPALGKCKVTSDFNTLSRDKVFLTIQKILNAELETLDDTHFVFKGKGCQ